MFAWRTAMEKELVKKPRGSMRNRPKSWTKFTCRKGSLDVGPNIAVSLLDVSETGLRLVVCEHLVKGQEIALTLETPGHARPIRVLGKAVWCLPTTDKNFCVGIRFDKCLAYFDVAKLS